MSTAQRLPPALPFTTLEALEREHLRLKEHPQPPMREREWREHLAKVLPFRSPAAREE